MNYILETSRDVAAWLVYVTIGNLFILITKIRDPLLKSQVYYYCIGKLLSLLLTGVKKNRYCTRCTVAPDDREDLFNCFRWKHYNFNIYVSLATDTLHLLLKGLVMKMLDFMQDITEQKAIIQQLVAIVSLLFVSKAPFALHFIRAVCDLYALTYIIQDIRMYGALDSICTRANSEAYYITIVKQFYSMTNKKEVTRSLPFRRLGWLILGIQPYLTKLPLSEVAANIAISDFTHAAAVFVGCMSVQIHSSIKCWRSSSKRHNDPEHCDEEVLYLILTIIDYTRYDKDGKHMAYIGAFSEVLLFNNNGQIDNTTRMLSVRRRAWNVASKRRILQAFKFYDLSTIIRLVHLVLRDLPDLTTRTTMSYYVNNYIDWDEYNCLYLLTFNIDLLRTLREYRRKRTRNN
ncbi:hypothetical protein HBI59_228420 [Parastagonospora nodorum]|nr:hypothetical protein HBI59_228420 [Parastagonospora nodorum]